MEKELKKIIILYMIFVLVKMILSLFITGSSVFSDEYVYSKLGWSIFNQAEYSIHGIGVSSPVPLYPILLSISYIFSNVSLIYFFMKILNILILSATIFPIYFLSRKFLNYKNTLILCLLAMLTPMLFNTNFYLMSENLYYPLFMTFVYFSYEALSRNCRKRSIISGVLLGLLFLTRAISGFIIPTFFVTYIFLRKKINFSRAIMHYTAALITVIPWFIRNGLKYGFTPKGLLGQYSMLGAKVTTTLNELIVPFINWFVLYFGYLILTTGVFFGIYFLLSLYIKEKEYKVLFSLFSAIIFFTLIGATNESASLRILYESPFKFFTRRPIGRYADPASLLMLIGGFISYIKLGFLKSKFFKFSMFTSLILAISSQLNIAPLLPFNNQSLALFGTLKYFIHYILSLSIENFYWIIFILFLIIFATIPLLFNIKLFARRCVTITIIFFIASSSLAFAINVKTSNDWSNSEQLIFSKSVGENIIGKRILFDQDNCGERVTKNDFMTICQKNKIDSVIGFWMNDKIEIGDVEQANKYDYVLTSKKMNYKIINNIKEMLYLYEVEK